MKKISKKYIKKAEIYKRLCEDVVSNKKATFDDDALLDYYNYESTGIPKINYSLKYKKYNNKFNGYAIGKHLYDLNISMIKDSLQKGDISKFELWYENYPEYIINSVLSQKEIDEIVEDNTYYTNKDLKVYFEEYGSLPDLEYIQMSEDPDNYTTMLLYISKVYKNNISE